jgi:Putative peptidase family
LIIGHIEKWHEAWEEPGPSTPFLKIVTHSASEVSLFPNQSWPIAGGHFKALVFLTPGANMLKLHCHGLPEVDEVTLNLTYLPLLQTPPLHLAILVAKDSPLLIDCPPAKAGGISTAHSDLQAAIAKFRTTAYMWQALTAEDMRAKGLGRRSFRLEEEWGVDTISRDFLNSTLTGDSLFRDGHAGSAMTATAKIHLVKSDKTTKEIRDPDVAQQNRGAHRDQDLHKWFTSALKTYGGPFVVEAHPIVAGLILDSHYSQEKDLILGHAALGASNPNAISLGMMGSHLTYSWPRFVEEVVPCLTDPRNPGGTVGNDANECASMWEACSIGQGAFLHEVGHAFGNPHRPGIMERGYSKYWPRCFLPFTAYCNRDQSLGLRLVTADTESMARWDIVDALSFMHQAHFRLPNDPLLTEDCKSAIPEVIVNVGHDDNFKPASITISGGRSNLGIARIQLPVSSLMMESLRIVQRSEPR